MNLSARLAVVGLVLVSFACTDHSIEPATRGRAVVSLRPDYVLAPGMIADGRPINRIRLIARNEATDAIVDTMKVDVNPDQPSWTLAFQLPILSASLRVIISIELINVTNGIETVEWSGRTGPILLTPNGATAEDVPVYRGPLENLQITALRITSQPGGLLEGDSVRVSATVGTSGTTAPQVFWSSGAATIFSVDASGMVRTLLPGSGWLYASAGRLIDSVRIVVAARPSALAITPGNATLDFIGAETVFQAQVTDRRGAAMTGIPVTWSVANSAVARSLGDGRFAAVATGSTGVTAQLANNAAVSANATLVVTQRPARIRVSPDSAVLNAVGDTARFTATVQDAGNAVIPQAAVTWGTSAPGIATVDANGLATGRGDGTATITASIGSLSASGRVVVRRNPVALRIVAGDGQSATVFSNVSTPPSVRVVDALGNGVSGVTVTFEVRSGGGQVTGATVVSDASGIATVGSWQLGRSVGPNTLAAVSTGLPTVLFTATGRADNPAAITIASGNGQTARPGQQLPAPIVVALTDYFGNPASGYDVRFTVLSGGGSVSPGTARTGTNGGASTTWTLGNSSGAQTLEARYLGMAVVISANAQANPSSIAISAGDNQSAVPGQAVAIAPAVVVRDAQNNPVAGATVTFAVTAGGGTLTGATATTNANGIATVGSWTLGAAPAINTLSATVAGLTAVSFTAFGTTGLPATVTASAGQNQSAAINTAVATAPTVLVHDDLGRPLANVAVNFAVTAGGGSATGTSATTNANGLASVGSWTLGATAGANSLTATVANLTPVVFNATATGTAAGPGSIAISTGGNQSAVPGTAVATPPAVFVRDAQNNPLAGVTVTFAVTAGGGTLTGATATTNANGIATVGSWTLGPAPAINTLTASVAGLNPITFTAFGTTGLPATVTASAGQNQSARINTAVAIAPTVLVNDDLNRPLANVTVTFAVTAGGGTATGTSATTNANGLASVGSWTLGPAVGTNSLTATVANLTPVVFTATATVGAPATVTIHQGDNQSVQVGTNVPINPAVIVRDSAGNRLPGITVTFAVASGGGGVTGATAVTDTAGIATVGSWTLGSTAGANTLTATVTGVPPVTFNATGTGVITPTLRIALVGRPHVGVSFTAPLRISTNVPAPAGGLQVTVTSGDVSRLTVASPGSVTILAGDTVANIDVTGVASGPVTVTATATGYTTAVQTIPVSLRLISMPASLTVAFGNSTSLPIQLAEAAPAGGTVVTVTSLDTTRVRVLTPTVNFAAGATLGSATVQGTLPGPANVTGTSNEYLAGSTNVVTQANLDVIPSLVGINQSFGGSFTIRLLSAGNGIAAPAPGIQVTLTAADPTCVSVPANVTIQTGLTQVNASAAYGGSAQLSCSTFVRASAPNITPDSLQIFVSATPAATITGGTVGNNLQRPVSFSLGASNHPGVTVRLTSSDSTRFVVSGSSTVLGGGTLDVVVPAGQTSGTVWIQSLGAGTGSFTITSSAPGFTTGNAAVTLVQGALDLTLNATALTTFSSDAGISARLGIAGGQQTNLVELQSVRPGAPPVVVTFTVADSTIARLVTQAFSGGARSVTAQVAVNNSTTPGSVASGGAAWRPFGSGATTISASAPGFISTTNATGNISVSAPALTISASAVGDGLQRGQFVSLGSSTHGGITVRLISTDPQRLLLSSAAGTVGTGILDVPLNNGTGGFTFYTQALEGASAGAPAGVSLIATAPGFTGDTVAVPILQAAIDIASVATQLTTLSPPALFVARIGISNQNFLTELQSVRAGGRGYVVTVTSGTPATAVLITNADTVGTASKQLTIGPGQTQTPGSLASGGVAIRPLAAGTTTISGTSAGAIATTNATANVTVSGSSITLQASRDVGGGLMASSFGQLSGSNHGGITVRLTSGDPAKMLLSPNATTAGTAFIDIPLANGNAFFNYYVHGLEGQIGSISVTASAPGFTNGSGTVNVVQSRLDLVSLPTTTTTLSSDHQIQVRVGVGSASFMNELQAVRIGGTTLRATVTSSTTAGLIVSSAGAAASGTADIAPGFSSTPFGAGGVAFRPFSSGTTTVSATIPNVFALPTASGTVTVTAPAITLSGATVGGGLMRGLSGNLASANHGGVTVRITSSNANVAQLAPNATTAAAAFIDIPLAAGQTFFSFYVHGIEGATGTIALTASAPGFTDGNSNVSVAQPAIDITGYSSNVNTASASSQLSVRIGVGMPFLNELQVVRFGGTPVNVTVNNSNPNAARLLNAAGATASSFVVTIGVGSSNSPANSLSIDPVAPGSTTITATAPNVGSTGNATATITVQQAFITMNTVNVGAGLQRTGFLSLSGGDHGGVTVRLTSTDPSKLLLAPNATTAGSATLDITIPQGQTGASFYVQGLDNTTGSVAVTATTTGFTNGSVDMSVVQAAFDVVGLNTNTNANAANDDFQVRIGIADALFTGLVELQERRAGAAALTVNVTVSDATRAALVTSAGSGANATLSITPGNLITPGSVATGGVQLDLLAPGNVTVTGAIAGFRVLPTSSVGVTIN